MGRRPPKSEQPSPAPTPVGGIDFAEIVKAVVHAQAATSAIMPQVREEIAKGWRQLPNSDPDRAPKSWFADPLSLQYSLGYKDRRYSVTFDTLKRIAAQLSVISAIINTRSAQVAAFTQPYRWTKSLGFIIKHKDPDHKTTPAEVAFIKELEQFVLNCGRSEPNPYSTVQRDDFDAFIRKIVRDSLTYDQCAAEVVYDRSGLPYEFYAVDATTIRYASDDRYVGINASYTDREGFVPSVPSRTGGLHEGRSYGYQTSMGQTIRYMQIVNGQIQNVYGDKDLAFGIRNPRTDIYIQGYGYGELEQLITIVTAHLNAESYNTKFFTQGSTPKGILNLKGDNWTPEQLEMFKRQWAANVAGVENCLSGETKIYTREHGFSSLSAICGDRVEVPVQLWTGSTWETGLVYKTKEPKILCRTTLDNGVVLATSPDHKIRVVGAAGEPEWRVQSELKLGDVVLVNKADTSAQTELHCFGKRVEEDFAEVLGWLLGDGHVGERDVRWFYHHEREQEILAAHLEVIRRYFPKAEKKTHVRSADEIEHICTTYGFKSVAPCTTMIVLNDTDAAAWLRAHDFVRDGKKTVPAHLSTMPYVHRAAYLRGLFSADGHNAKGRSPAVTICDDSIRTAVKHLLLSVGVRCSLSEGKTKLRLQGRERQRVEKPSVLRVKDRDVFFDHVGFLQPHKQPVGLKKLNQSNKLDAVPRSAVQKYLTQVREANVAAEYKLLTRRERMDLNSILSGADGCSRPRLLRYLQLTQIQTPAWMTQFSTASVVSTENTGLAIPMYDVSVNHPDHAFIGDNILVSNSWRTPILQSEGLEWVELAKSNQEMEFGRWMEYLLKVGCAVYLIDPAEINFDLHGGVQQTPLFESSQEWKLKASRDRGLKPLLRFLAKLINKNIIDRIDDHFTLEFAGLDEMSEQEKHEMLVEQIASYMTLNEARRTLDLPDLPGGDMPMNPTYMAALTTQQQLEAGVQGADGGDASQDPNAEPPQQTDTPAEPQYSGHFGLADASTGGEQ